tara:strand:+ start:293 stop:1099 length:807 start_codon:yes stop_codon:yes gene_type:complete
MKLELSNSDISKPILSDELVAKGIDIFLKEGALWINSVIPLDLLNLANKEIKQYIENIEQRNEDKLNLKVGDRRYMEPINIKDPFNDNRLFCPVKVLQILVSILGRDLVLNSYTAVISLPGAKNQHVHSDGSNLFTTEINVPLPPHAITLAIPLIKLDENCGSTAIWVKSHLEGMNVVVDSNTKQTLPAPFPLPNLGDIYMFDYRVKHAGMANKSDYARPILYIVFSKPWWIDPSNFSANYKPINITSEELKSIPANILPLFRLVNPF